MRYLWAFLLSFFIHFLIIFALVRFYPHMGQPKEEGIPIRISSVKVEEVKPKREIIKQKLRKKKLVKKTKKKIVRKKKEVRTAKRIKKLRKVREVKPKEEIPPKKEEKRLESQPEEVVEAKKEEEVTPEPEKVEMPKSEKVETLPVEKEEEERVDYQKAYEEENLAKIREAIQSCLTYPLIARRMGWEGTVIVRFKLSPEGKLEEAKVEKSSGFEILDRNALEILRIASRSFPKPKREVVLVVPIVYSLE